MSDWTDQENGDSAHSSGARVIDQSNIALIRYVVIRADGEVFTTCPCCHNQFATLRAAKRVAEASLVELAALRMIADG
jgi:hypothetical protein